MIVRFSRLRRTALKPRAGTLMAVLTVAVIALTISQNQYGAAYYTSAYVDVIGQGPPACLNGGAGLNLRMAGVRCATAAAGAGGMSYLQGSSRSRSLLRWYVRPSLRLRCSHSGSSSGHSVANDGAQLSRHPQPSQLLAQRSTPSWAPLSNGSST